MKKLIVARDHHDDSHLPSHLHPVIKQIYASRQVNHADELNNSAATLHDFKLFKDIDKATALLQHALRAQSKVLIVGDFDADGATSTATLMQGLAMFGFAHLDYLVPDRFSLGYGLSPALAEQIVTMAPDLVITVDNGISCIAGIAIVKAAGIKVLVTDHHLQGEQLPNADAIVNPNRHDCEFPSKSIAGVGVAFYLLIALRSALRDVGHFAQQPPPNLADLLDIVALGTVADVVALDANNRTLVHQGLARIRSGKTRPGITALIEVANRNAARLSASDFGFSLAPRLNAAGRLDDMSLGIACLLATDINQARRIAAELDSLNHERREIEQGMQLEAQAVLDKLAFSDEQTPDAICLYQEDWHQGVIGILAGRLKEKYHRPTVIFAGGDNGEIKGSCRSIEGLHMRDLLERLNTLHPHLISKFGGHAMAAGLSINEQHFSEFKREFEQAVSGQLSEEHKRCIILTDGELADDCFSMEFANVLKQAGPWGQQFPEPVFEHTFELVQQRIVGEKHLKLVLKHRSGRLVDAIAFGIDVREWPDTEARLVKLAYQLDINEFRGKFSLQLIVRELQKVA
ncbi:single-stranded-DNA-specific exonuclease RecJ [Pseudoalteromonas sp. SR44-5]|jgi:single-stranded-DNA-specific exonuclease|uniref:Single-stranded-DNA-specific exonuclease RecJ n=1 Tax=Pseudoalteromonas neustonica TaxID=1840331 RepID=A0ABY3FAR7_9GAMM|nr:MULTISPECIES: single-stranded-DNA-specific exonuclease RecJ [Pseudoalteromonas]MBB1366400.1 single-stranded-DNA-specific exonuclease RecJ [Pseudoalteromonas sp. SR44-5]MBB1398490.1 single-stranded-DNA-specific exonuclease RecJ [Pseudoalteromonas sp. SG44-8]MBB1408154.1 single-stranded-DNA-specific exonuclease RecJ [Pseudoalteromonas sp. SG44-17]MBB1417270.1 single-stranded-DNA-specific exonuclease RecJ [Pseudoalteromonas sp. SG44-1]MBB1421092.1 single-stranded-DNA-specific exonuclease RecJ 